MMGEGIGTGIDGIALDDGATLPKKAPGIMGAMGAGIGIGIGIGGGAMAVGGGGGGAAAATDEEREENEEEVGPAAYDFAKKAAGGEAPPRGDGAPRPAAGELGAIALRGDAASSLVGALSLGVVIILVRTVVVELDDDDDRVKVLR